jgi:hypothetical protein
MRYAWVCSVLLILLQSRYSRALSDAVPDIAGPSLLENGQFESKGEGKNCPFASWAARSGNNGQYVFTLVPGRTGQAAKIEGMKEGRGDIHNANDFAVKAGETLRVRFWAKMQNFKGGAFASLEGEPNENGWHKINIDNTSDWKLYECRVVVPTGEKGQVKPAISIWFYNFGTGALLLDDIGACVVETDPAGAPRQELARIRAWLTNTEFPSDLQRSLIPLVEKVDASLKQPTVEAAIALRREALSKLGALHRSDGTFAVGVAHCLEQVFLDELYAGSFLPVLKIGVAQHEAEGAQVVVLSCGKELQNVSVQVEGALKSVSGAMLPGEQVSIQLVGYVNTAEGKRPFQSKKLGWWPDPLLPNEAFSVKADETQPLLLKVTTTSKTEPGTYTGTVSIKCGAVKATLPIEVEVFPFALPARGHFESMAQGCKEEVIVKYYGGDVDGKIMERFISEACKHRMPPVQLLNGWSWKAPAVPKGADGSYDFRKLDRWFELMAPNGLTRFPMAFVPRFRKFGGGDYTEEFKREFASFVKVYAEYLKKKGLYDRALIYNIDEASNEPKLREWEECKEIYKLVKRVAPEVPVIQCLNEYKGVQALAGHADIWDLYYGQYEQAGGPERLKAGDSIYLSVCIWPSEHPNAFIEYPLLDKRVMPWISFRVGAKGTEYWDMIYGWPENINNKEWFKSGLGTRTAWKPKPPAGEGQLLYPGPDGVPYSSLRLEAIRDGIEDYEYLHLLSERAKHDREAATLLAEATQQVVTGVTSYDADPLHLLELRRRIAKCLSAAR